MDAQIRAAPFYVERSPEHMSDLTGLDLVLDRGALTAPGAYGALALTGTDGTREVKLLLQGHF